LEYQSVHELFNEVIDHFVQDAIYGVERVGVVIFIPFPTPRGDMPTFAIAVAIVILIVRILDAVVIVVVIIFINAYMQFENVCAIGIDDGNVRGFEPGLDNGFDRLRGVAVNFAVNFDGDVYAFFGVMEMQNSRRGAFGCRGTGFACEAWRQDQPDNGQANKNPVQIL
jgi:hypothetical protein